ncbi:MAG TPA: hypothetical protein VK508_03265 [Cyclobacteriaceae bacterium]|nr:hypothetical protein [Cyclobacteriaceae bacterium]
MKKSLVWVVLIGFALTLNSCGKDDPEPVSLVVGTWSRAEYEFTDLPTGFTENWDGFTITSFGETGYTFVFKADGTYTRSVTPAINDKGKWTQTDANLKVSPDDPDKQDDIEDSGFIGLEFTVEGEISDTRMVLSRVITLSLASDAAIAAAGGDIDQVPDEEFKPVDVKILYKFNRL